MALPSILSKLLCTFSIILLFASVSCADTFWCPYTYHEDFNEGELNAWASYPPNQDTAYDPYTYPGVITPDDGSTCLVASSVPPWNETQRLGAVKRFHCFLDEESEISFIFYIKSVSPCPELTVHIPLATGERLMYRLTNPETNSWQSLALVLRDLTQNVPAVRDRDIVEISALAIQLKIPDADPDMPIFLGLDDIEVRGLRKPSFQFKTPATATLPEFRDHVFLDHYRPGETFHIEGEFETKPLSAELLISPYLKPETVLFSGTLQNNGTSVFTCDTALDSRSFPAGLYRGKILADYGDSRFVETSFAFLVERNENRSGHPRLIYDDHSITEIRKRLQSARYKAVQATIEKESGRLRNELDPVTLIYDTNQFPDKDWLATLSAWSGDRIRISREALFFNALAFSLLDNREAGEYCRKVMLMLADWPRWNHPWMEKRGFHTYYPLGEFALNYSIAYDLCYDILDEGERGKIRNALYDNFIDPAFKSYVIDDLVTSNSSNWISHIMGGALFALAAVDEDISGDRPAEPLLIGSLMKMHNYIATAFGRDGSYGEGFRYFNFAMQSFAWTLPAIERRFGVDFSGPLKTAHLETLWASNLAQNYAYTFGDSEPFLKREATAKWIAAQNGPMNSWTWLIERSRDPILKWLYQELKEYDTIHEVLYDIDDVQAGPPDSLGMVAFFRDVGTAVFKSGWGGDDFTFVFRCGPFYNHQHLDQGTFFLADHGEIFIEERHDGEHHYYDDPVYRSHAIQPIGHNTVIIDSNPQSQKTGDPKDFAPGMNDQARFTQWLDSEHFAFVFGDLSPVYPDGPQKLSRSILYIKPRTILMLDRAESDKDREIGLLFHTKWKKDIESGDDRILFRKDGSVLNLIPLAPSGVTQDILSEPHFLAQFKERPLVERGYLKLSAHTEHDRPLVMANLMTAAADGSDPGIRISNSDGLVSAVCPAGNGEAEISLRTANKINSLDSWRSDALVLACHSDDTGVFMVNGTALEGNGGTLLTSENPLTASYRKDSHSIVLEFFSGTENAINIAADAKPVTIKPGGAEDITAKYDPATKAVLVSVEAGEGTIRIDW